jgi:hypothetical protein
MIKNDWTREEVQLHLVNKKMVHLCSKIDLKQTKLNPVRQWEDANWMHEWVKPSGTSALCIIIALINYDKEVFTLKAQHSYKQGCLCVQSSVRHVRQIRWKAVK